MPEIPDLSRVTAVQTFPILRGPQRVVVLDRIVPGELPEYCIHGRATCVGGCNDWVWLGNRTHDLVANRHAYPICHECAMRIALCGGGTDMQPMINVKDHLRTDGPHE